MMLPRWNARADHDVDTEEKRVAHFCGGPPTSRLSNKTSTVESLAPMLMWQELASLSPLQPHLERRSLW